MLQTVPCVYLGLDFITKLIVHKLQAIISTVVEGKVSME